MNRRSECRLFARKLIFIYLLLRPQTVWKFYAVQGAPLVTAGPLAQKKKRTAYILLLVCFYDY